jgi:hypothetical protein
MAAAMVNAGEETREVSRRVFVFFFMVLESRARQDQDRICQWLTAHPGKHSAGISSSGPRFKI